MHCSIGILASEHVIVRSFSSTSKSFSSYYDSRYVTYRSSPAIDEIKGEAEIRTPWEVIAPVYRSSLIVPSSALPETTLREIFLSKVLSFFLRAAA